MQALLYAVLMIPISLWPTYLHVTGIPYAIAAFALGLWYLYATIRFARIVRSPEDPANRSVARNLLKVSVMYLPLLLLAMALNAQGRLLF
jgi:protoheme IX farnesyltransferase